MGARRPRFGIQVTFPSDWADEPQLAGCTFWFWYPTEDAALLAKRGFQLRGAVA